MLKRKVPGAVVVAGDPPVLRDKSFVMAKPASLEPLHIKYRPVALADLLGQSAVAANLQKLYDTGRLPHSFLFTGPSGTGKTTLARIVASMLGCLSINILEIDAARFSGIDSMREILVGTQYVSLGQSPRKLIIVDECHALSKQTWQTLLKKVEEPEPHLYWVFCTTEAEKVPKTIRTRCHAYDMKPVRWDELAAYLQDVATSEKLEVPEDFIGIAARRADGSVRQGLVFLSMLNGIVEKEEALRLLDTFEEGADGGPVMLARALVKGCSWDDARVILLDLEDVSPETIRMTVLMYTAAVAKNAKTVKQAEPLLAIMAAFSQPWNASEKLAPALLAIGQLTIG